MTAELKSLLRKLSLRDVSHEIDEHGNLISVVKDPHALIQTAGYLKYTRGQKDEAIYFRGQSSTYPELRPSLFRGIDGSQAAQSRRVERKNSYVAEIKSKCAIFSTFSELAHEPLLQHYGLSTTWVDLVDNIWVALWFACHKAHVTGRHSEYLHFEKRVPRTEPARSFAYIVLVATDALDTGVHGYRAGDQTELVDLRTMCPSVFLRPHAQHGVLFRCKGSGVSRPIDYSTQVRGIVAIELADALEWLGDAKTLGIHSLFPPPFYDFGYRILLEAGIESGDVGSIHAIGA